MPILHVQLSLSLKYIEQQYKHRFNKSMAHVWKIAIII